MKSYRNLILIPNAANFQENINLDIKTSRAVKNLAAKDDMTTALDFVMANKKLIDDLNYFGNYFSFDGFQLT